MCIENNNTKTTKTKTTKSKTKPATSIPYSGENDPEPNNVHPTTHSVRTAFLQEAPVARPEFRTPAYRYSDPATSKAYARAVARPARGVLADEVIKPERKMKPQHTDKHITTPPTTPPATHTQSYVATAARPNVWTPTPSPAPQPSAPRPELLITFRATNKTQTRNMVYSVFHSFEQPRDARGRATGPVKHTIGVLKTEQYKDSLTKSASVFTDQAARTLFDMVKARLEEVDAWVIARRQEEARMGRDPHITNDPHFANDFIAAMSLLTPAEKVKTTKC